MADGNFVSREDESFKKDLNGIASSLIDEGAENISVLLINIDRFRSINESLGRNSGDKVLNYLYSRLVELSPDFLPIHIFSDNFIIVTNNSIVSYKLAELIIEDFKHPIDINGTNIYINISMGVATNAAQTDLSAETTLTNAEAALHLNKRTSSTKVHNYEKHIHAPSCDEIQLEHAIRSGIENNEFTIYLQPKFTPEKVLAGAEALIRWNHPTRGVLSPAAFIQLAEKSWLISDLTKIVFKKTVDYIKVLQKNNIDISVAFNMSTKVLDGDPSIVPYIEETLFDTGLASLVEMEIIETALLDSSKSTMISIQKLRDLGIKISLDDFGTGYSSFSYLSKYPVQSIKIDQSFIHGIHENHNLAITRAIVNLSKELDMTVIAEGIETKEQLDILKELNVDLIQGFYFAKPQSLDDFIANYKS